MHRDDRASSCPSSPGDRSGADAGVGVWTGAFERLHQAATSGASTAEVARLAAAELDELIEREEQAGWDR